LIGDGGPPDVENDPDDAFSDVGSRSDSHDPEPAILDAAITRSKRVLDRQAAPSAGALVYDVDWNEDERLRAWQAVVDQAHIASLAMLADKCSGRKCANRCLCLRWVLLGAGDAAPLHDRTVLLESVVRAGVSGDSDHALQPLRHIGFRAPGFPHP